MSSHGVLFQLLDLCQIHIDRHVFESLSLAEKINAYHRYIPSIEGGLWQQGFSSQQLGLFYRLFHELENLLEQQGDDSRHHFIVAMPLADRPRHLKDCLNSLLALCKNFQYGGCNQQQQFDRVSVLIADDSRDRENIRQHKQIIDDFSRQGLRIEYFGLEQQQQQLNNLPSAALQAITGQYPQGVEGHKGASITRNISYLRLYELQKQYPRCLIYFIDSDQEFVVNQPTDQGSRKLPVVNYFYYLDRIFSHTDACVLTGKVVGDPPVAPAVMAGKFMDDVAAFLEEIKGLDPHQPCSFHQHVRPLEDGAYHDMAELFGLSVSSQSCDYQCSLDSDHDHVETLQDFAEKISHFFDGEHPTRKSFYEYQDVMDNLQRARTVYTGNYIFRPEALEYFIPFAPLKLRMAGPTLGRIMKAELGARFVSANLPMLHQRTVEGLGQSEYRPGIARLHSQVDLEVEFERQFFGDVMLFGMEKLCALGYPEKPLSEAVIMETMTKTEADLWSKYQHRHQQLIRQIHALEHLFDGHAWWHDLGEVDEACQQIQAFIQNMKHNFGSHARAYQLIADPQHKQERIRGIVHGLMAYPDDRQQWQGLMQ